MIAIMYIGQRRFQETTRRNHEQFIQELSEEFSVKLYDFIKDAPDLTCPYQASGPVQVWDFVKGIDTVQEEIVIKLRSDVWFTKSAIKIIIQKLRKVVDGLLDLAYLGINLRHHYDKECYIENALNSKKVMDFIIIARKGKLKSSSDILTSLTNSDKEKSGNKFFRLLLTPDTKAVSVSCHLYLVRADYMHPENWHVLTDWTAEYRKMEAAVQWIAANRTFIEQL